MSIKFPLIVVDWGTTSMRAMLCESVDASLDNVERLDGPGISKLRETVSSAFFKAIESWLARYDSPSIILGGMVGSNIGWHTTPYAECPLDPAGLAAQLFSFKENDLEIAIVPGVRCINAYGEPDVMRGEEVQILGWLAENESDATGERILCLPGTHAKWVRIHDAKIERFTTSLTGEVFSILREHSILLRSTGEHSPEFDPDSFAAGVDAARQHGDHLLQMLFSTRSRSLCDPPALSDPASYLSGLLIGADVRSGLASNDTGGLPVELIGAPNLCEKYDMAIRQFGYEARTSVGDEMVLAGFLAIAGAAQ